MELGSHVLANWKEGESVLHSGWLFSDNVSAIMWKTGITSSKFGYIVRETFQQTVEDSSWFLLTTWSKRKEID